METNLLTARGALLLLAALLFAAQLRAIEPFVHTTTPENLDGHMTRLDHSTLNGQPDKLLFVTPVLGVENPHTVGVWYDKATGQWTIYNEDRVVMPEGAMFNVVAIDPSAPSAFTHTTTPENTVDYYTIISHPTSDYEAKAKLLITPNWSESYAPGPLGVWFDGEHWSIYRQDKEPIAPGVRFNVMVVPAGKTDVSGLDPFIVDAETHRAGFAVTRKNVTELQNLKPDAILFIAHNWSEKGPYNYGVPALQFNGLHWNIVNQNAVNFEHGAMFNVFTFSPSLAPAIQAAPIDRRIGWMKVINSGSFAARFKLTYTLDGSAHLATSGTMQPNSEKEFKVPMRATDLKLIGEITDGKSMLTPVDVTFTQIPNKAYQIDGSMTMPLWGDVPAKQGVK